jgi:hypothetical protein
MPFTEIDIVTSAGLCGGDIQETEVVDPYIACVIVLSNRQTKVDDLIKLEPKIVTIWPPSAKENDGNTFSTTIGWIYSILTVDSTSRSFRSS